MKSFIYILFLIGICGFSVLAQQTIDDEDIQSWNDVQLAVPLNKKVDFFIQGTLRFGNNISQLTDHRIAVGYVLKPTQSIAITPFYWNISTRDARGVFRRENALVLRALYRFPTKGFGLSYRNQYEYRMRRPRKSWRNRSMLTFDKDIPKKFIPKAKFFVQNEVFYESALKKFSRNRFMIGINKTLTKKLSVDVYYMRQNDGFSRLGDLNVLWTTWRIRW